MPSVKYSLWLAATWRRKHQPSASNPDIAYVLPTIGKPADFIPHSFVDDIETLHKQIADKANIITESKYQFYGIR